MAEEGGQGGFSPPPPPPPKFSDRSDDDMLPYYKYMYSINMSNVPGVLPGVHLSTVVYSFLNSSSLTSLLHLTMHASRLGLRPNFQALILFLWLQADPSQSVKVKLFDRGTRS